MKLNGRVALITGGARRVGRAIALRLARAGCHVAIHYHTSSAEAEATARECRAGGTNATTHAADLADPAAPPALVQNVLSVHQRLDIVINNAGTFEPMSLEQFDYAAWETTMRVNCTAVMALVHAARDELRRNRGRVINLCDASTSRPWPNYLAYIVSKGALDTLTRVLARALAPQVNVVGIAPGVADWPENYPLEKRERLLRRIPLARSGAPEDIAAAVHFVLSEGDYITGAILPVDGGRSIA